MTLLHRFSGQTPSRSELYEDKGRFYVDVFLWNEYYNTQEFDNFDQALEACNTPPDVGKMLRTDQHKQRLIGRQS